MSTYTFDIDTNTMNTMDIDMNNPYSYQNMMNIINRYTSEGVIKKLNPYRFAVTQLNIVKPRAPFNGYRSLSNFPDCRPLNTMLNNANTCQLNNIINKLNNYHNLNNGILGNELRNYMDINMRLIYSIKKHENVSDENECIKKYIINLNDEMFGFENLNVDNMIYNSKKGESWVKLIDRQNKIDEFMNTTIENKHNYYGMAYKVLEQVYGMDLDHDDIVPFPDDPVSVPVVQINA